MAGDLNREASELWNSLKPIIDKEIDARTQGMVQRRKAKVTTAPSLVTNTIGVTEPFGTEMFLPFNTNIMSASVGDFVWVEYMYGMTNAFVSMFASTDDKNQYVAGNLTVGGVLDVTPRRCYATLSSEGWYRVMTFDSNGGVNALGGSGAIIDINITRRYSAGMNEVHKVTLLCRYNGVSFVGEESSAGVLEIDKIRWCYETGNTSKGHLDIHYNYSDSDVVSVRFDVSTIPAYQQFYSANALESVAESPGGETVLTEYTFAANITPTYLKRYVDSTAANYTIGSAGYVIVSYPSGLTGNKVVSIGIETWTSNSGPFLICPYGSTNTYWFIIGSSGTTINGIKFVYWYID